jgi:hypothetical protein
MKTRATSGAWNFRRRSGRPRHGNNRPRVSARMQLVTGGSPTLGHQNITKNNFSITLLSSKDSDRRSPYRNALNMMSNLS